MRSLAEPGDGGERSPRPARDPRLALGARLVRRLPGSAKNRACVVVVRIQLRWMAMAEDRRRTDSCPSASANATASSSSAAAAAAAAAFA